MLRQEISPSNKVKKGGKKYQTQILSWVTLSYQQTAVKEGKFRQNYDMQFPNTTCSITEEWTLCLTSKTGASSLLALHVSHYFYTILVICDTIVKFLALSIITVKEKSSSIKPNNLTPALFVNIYPKTAAYRKNTDVW